MDEFFLKLLDDREIRAQRQDHMIKKYEKPIISYMLNTPGPVKKSSKFVKFHDYGFGLIQDKFEEDIIACDYYPNDTGMYYLISIDMEALDIKKKTVEIEENIQGARLFDIDVFDENFEQISRTDLGLDRRKCIVCDDYAKNCIVGKKHSYEELISTMEDIIDSTLDTKK